MSTTLTRERRDRHVAALREAHRTGRRKAIGSPYRTAPDGTIDAVCTCVIIAEAEGHTVDEVRERGDTWLYNFVTSLGYPGSEGPASRRVFPRPVLFNDAYFLLGDPSTFADVADMIEALEVIDEAETICRDAVAVSA